MEKDYEIYEVFSQKEPTGKYESQFSLLAPSPEIALAMAQENFLRREDPPANLFVVNRRHIHFISPEARVALRRMDNKAYRMPGYYGRVLKKWHELKARRGIGDRLLKVEEDG
ncbi:1,2-phenylacetyl-CoA epoxidase subunit B [Hydrogenibacillus schlegelii]|uniref:1,2-phenylacetyl-CoA epoxidase subunit B n=1 Tax=Hydrogenibacillus schlegelii TaxID=1484 RepID=A0A132MFT2_HYDSH|nr:MULTISPECIES: hypothetical protein [Hydrogenibacillus]KWW96697.1 hypothetical protein TR75_12665 [Hydrogenibacillus schlegelii]MBT9281897.1 1,2-phenylacetyl-CoA epoxidase subunit B [Hydrogenibacillus schlegelii]OAR05321.1 hypothetical protein SA87_08110 [Hydrogenibacillus schlegelii]PTQ52333.1 MAG: Phenylacetic acid degradation protein PaaB [Hydrogenibacillus schlegelii]QZA31962.1 1,2-phenylacetyl-CoA epoxidase subunit B [Hydrogenibacillus sp. N12]